MRKTIAALGLVALSGCSTPQVTDSCSEAVVLAKAAQPYLVAASPEVKAAVMAVGAIGLACGSAEYAMWREQIRAFLIAKGGLIK